MRIQMVVSKFAANEIREFFQVTGKSNLQNRELVPSASTVEEAANGVQMSRTWAHDLRLC